jgi:hypothetical protein
VKSLFISIFQPICTFSCAKGMSLSVSNRSAPSIFVALGLVSAVTASLTSGVAYGMGPTAFSFLENPSSSRDQGMGGASTALASGQEGVEINPAGLAGTSLGLTFGARYHTLGVGGANFAYGFPGDGPWVFAVSAAARSYGELEMLDERGNVAGEALRPTSLSPSFSVARSMGDRWRWGATAKWAQSYLGDFEGSRMAYGVGFDVGSQFQPSAKNWGFGMALKNVGRVLEGPVADAGGNGAFPGSAAAGVYYHPRDWKGALVALDGVLPFSGAPLLALGLEMQFLEGALLRTGTRWDRDDIMNAYRWAASEESAFHGGNSLKWTGGGTLKSGRYTIDYALQWWRWLGFSHQISLSVGAG